MVEKQKRREHKRMRLTSGVQLGMSSYYGSGDWLRFLHPAEIGRCEKHLAPVDSRLWGSDRLFYYYFFKLVF